MFDILPAISQWLAEGQTVALATVIQTWGSAPRPVGAKMGILADLRLAGSVSGGCVESAVIEEALNVLEDGQPRHLHFGVSDDTAWEVGLACGGQIAVVVEKLDLAWWQVVSTRLEQGEALVTAHLITPNQLTARWVWRNQDLCYASPAPRTVSLPADVPTLAQIALQQRQTQVIETQGLRFLLDVHLPKPHLIVIGGAHVAISLQHLAQALGFRMTLIDPRRTFATQERFPLVEQIVHHYPSKAFEEIPLTPDTYLVVLTHDSKIDDPTLAIALDSPVRYIGVMSSRKTHTKRLARLREKGFTEAQLSRIHAPIGLNIPTQTPEEIALSIMAEIIASKNSSHDHRISPLS